MRKVIRPKPIKTKQSRSIYEKILQKDESYHKQYEMTPNLLENESILKDIFLGCSDVIFRHIQISKDIKGLIVYIDGLIDMNHLDNVILKQLMLKEIPEGINDFEYVDEILDKQVISVGQIKTVSSISEVISNVLNGSAAILIGGQNKALIAGISGGERRSISEPITETIIRGPREGFTEDIATNISLLRRKLRTPRLKMESFTMGKITNTNVTITYIRDVARDSVIQEVKNRLGKIEIDGVLESSYIEEMIEDRTYTPFPLMMNTERPDVVAAGLLEGKVAIFTDNTPFVLLVPVVFWSHIQSSEDYYVRSTMGTFLRWIRLIYMFVALLVPSLYVAAITFHQQLIPPKLLMSIVDNREPTPFPAFIEALIMEITFEALREAGIRLPKPVGQAVSIVGALVIGQAAVEAGIISAPMVIIVSITGIASFTIPRYDFSYAVRVLRFPMIFLAGAFGLYGITLGMLALMIHLVSLRSFGVPYFSPAAPISIQGIKDIFIRTPRWNLKSRPELITDYNNIRVPPGQKPGPKRGKKGED